MFVKDADGDFVNILLLTNIANRGNFVEGILNDGECAVIYKGENCQAYMAELEKELKAYGKLILVEVKPEIKCTCGNNDKPVWEHAENCAVYAPF